MNESLTNKIIRLSISEASKIFGVSQQTIRRAIRDGELRYIVVAGRYKIAFENLLKWSQDRTTLKNKLANRGIGRFVNQWKIKNTLYSPNPKLFERPDNQAKDSSDPGIKGST